MIKVAVSLETGFKMVDFVNGKQRYFLKKYVSPRIRSRGISGSGRVGSKRGDEGSQGYEGYKYGCGYDGDVSEGDNGTR